MSFYVDLPNLKLSL